MSRSQRVLSGLLTHRPLAVALSLLGFTGFALATYPGKEPPEPLPVIGPGGMLVIGLCLLVMVLLAFCFSALPVVRSEERRTLRILLLAFGILTLPWFWHTRLWRVG